MNPTTLLHRAGQSLWLDHIDHDLLGTGTLQRYIDELSVTGLTSNPTIYGKAIRGTEAYDRGIRESLEADRSSEETFFDLAIDDLQHAADAFRLVHERSSGIDGFVSLEVSPLLAHDAEGTIEQARRLHDQGRRDNLFIKIPGTPAGLTAIEECIFEGVPINVTLLFTPEHYLAAAAAYMRGLERRVEAGRDTAVPSVASLFISRWDVAVAERVPAELRNRLGLAVGRAAYRAYRELLDSDRWQRLANHGARAQRLLFASTGTKDPDASDVLYVAGFASPNTVNTMPEQTLLAYADHGGAPELLPRDGGNVDEELAAFEAAGVDLTALGQQLQEDGAQAFVDSWHELIDLISSKRGQLSAAM
ncbi:MAG: transaldolase [Candidatus Limnocylindrales bacterium]